MHLDQQSFSPGSKTTAQSRMRFKRLAKLPGSKFSCVKCTWKEYRVSCIESALNGVKQLLAVPGQKCHTLQGKQLDPSLSLGNLIYSYGTAYKVQCLK